MITVGKYRIGAAGASVIVVFVALSICAVVAAVRQARPEWPMPLWMIILVNECMAMLATLVYGIVAHIVLSLINRKKTS